MKFKVVPEPAGSVETIATVQRAVPLVPDDETSCCARLMRRTDVASQDRAKEWLTFLRALELVAETDGSYHRLQVDPDTVALDESFRERVYLADEILSVLADAEEPLAHGAVFDRVADHVPHWERLSKTDAESVWRERVRRILEWSVTLGLAERRDGGYVAV